MTVGSEQQRCNAGAGRCGARGSRPFGLGRRPSLGRHVDCNLHQYIGKAILMVSLPCQCPNHAQVAKGSPQVRKTSPLYVAAAASTQHQPTNAALLCKYTCISSNLTSVQNSAPNARYYSSRWEWATSVTRKLERRPDDDYPQATLGSKSKSGRHVAKWATAPTQNCRARNTQKWEENRGNGRR